MLQEKKDLSAALAKHLPPQEKEPEVQKTDLVDDYEYSRQKYRQLLDQASDALERAIDLAQQSEHPKAFGAVKDLLDSAAKITDRFVDLQRKMQVIKNEELNPTTGPAARAAGKTAGSLTQTNVFVGSPADLKKMMKDGSIPLPPDQTPPVTNASS